MVATDYLRSLNVEVVQYIDYHMMGEWQVIRQTEYKVPSGCIYYIYFLSLTKSVLDEPVNSLKCLAFFTDTIKMAFILLQEKGRNSENSNIYIS